MNQLENKKVLIMAGGTGGHIFPALSIAEYLLSKGMHVEWLGTENSMEAEVIGNTDIPIHYISISGLRGKSLWKKVFSPFVILLAVVQSMIKLASIKPACVLGMGGFVTGPGGLAAWLLRKNLLIHEQNAIAGFTNQMLVPFSTTVMEAFPGAFKRKQDISSSILSSMIKPEKAILVGNPVRADITNCLEPAQRFVLDSESRLKVLVIGGSLGAVAINKVIPKTLALFSGNNRPELMHQCGRKNVDETLGFYSAENIELNENIKVQPFIEDMAASYSWADMIICRAGAITISEIASIGLPAVLIPYPYAVDDHQTVNASVLESKQAGWLIQEDQLCAEVLFEKISTLITDRQRILTMANAARTASNDSATEKVAEYCMEACYA